MTPSANSQALGGFALGCGVGCGAGAGSSAVSRTGSNVVTPVVVSCRLLIGVLRSGLLGGGEMRDRAHAAEAALAAAEIHDRCGEIVAAEVGPQHVDEAELGVGRFPEQEIGQP